MTKNEDLKKAAALEKEAAVLLKEKKINEAFEAYQETAHIYQLHDEPLKAALCFASAASCWHIRSGHQPLRVTASCSEQAAHEAMKAKAYDYARWLYREAAMFYEQEGDDERYSACFFNAQEALQKSLWATFLSGKKKEESTEGSIPVLWNQRVLAFFKGLMGLTSRFLWGYGERPMRTLAAAFFVIVFSAFLYKISGHIRAEDMLRPINFGEALYFSMVTFATVGYGDYLPMGWARIVAVLEGMSGIFLTPLFLVALTRRYLRLYH